MEGGGYGSASGRPLNSDRCDSSPERVSSTPLPQQSNPSKSIQIMQQIQYISTAVLRESSMNPRRTFEKTDIEELAVSIKEVGIIQPLIVRPSTTYDGLFEVVCGSRRLAAALIADCSDVPAIVRNISDEEAFDLMITENLQRKDVSPLEEASAFQSLINKGKYDYYSLADRFGKSVTYIRHRLKLNDLIEDFKKLLIEDVITISHAFEIAKLEAVYQQELYKEEFEDRHQYWKCPTLRQLKGKIERRFTLKLIDAPFNLTDATLDKRAGACVGCLKNTASDASLFPDSPETGLCLDAICFKNKLNIHLMREIERLQNEEPDVIIGIPSYLYGDDEHKAKTLKEAGVPVVAVSYSNGFYEVSEPSQPEPPDAGDYETPEEYKEAMEEYLEEQKEYESDLAEYQEKVASGTLRKVFMALGNEKGRTLYYELNHMAQTDTGSMTGAKINKKDQIKELQEKDKRNGEIAFEKIYNDALQLLKENSYSSNEKELTLIEWEALYVVMLDNMGYGSTLRDELIPEGRSYLRNDDLIDIAVKLDIKQINRLFRAFLINKLTTSTPNYSSSHAKSLIKIAEQIWPDQAKEIELKHNGIYLKRKENIENKIAELKNQ